METFWFIVSKVTTPFTSPFTILLAIIPVILFQFKPAPRRGWLKTAGFAVWGLVLALSLPAASRTLASIWEVPLGNINLVKENPGPGFDVILVLGGTVKTDINDGWHIELNDSAERLTEAARLYKMGAAPRILVSSGSGLLGSPEKKEAPFMKKFLAEMGVPAEAIFEESLSRNTFENAVESKKLLAIAGWKRCLLVTSAFHMRRSEAIFRKAGFLDYGEQAASPEFSFLPFPVDTMKKPVVFPEFILPAPWALEDSSTILHEIAGFVAYRILGRL